MKAEGRDLIEYVLLPGLAAVLPWPVCFQIFRRLSRWSWLYGAECAEAFQQANARNQGGGDAAAWLTQRRLTTLIDHADHYLFRTRSARWLAKYMDVDGQWPQGDRPAMLWTFHWGMGLWALCHARAHGITAHMVLAAPGGPDFVGRSVFGRYVRARMRSVEMALGEPVIFVPGGMDKIREAFNHRKQLVVVMDVPQDQVSVTRITRLLDQGVSVPAVLPNIAVQRGMPVAVYYSGVHMRSGRRSLHIADLGVHTDPAVLADTAFAHLDHLLRTAPAAWHLWAQAPRFFVARDQVGNI